MPVDSPQFNDGEAYERLMGRWSRKVGVPFISWLGAGRGLTWLDAGCGNGAFTEDIVTTGPAAVAAIDPAQGQIDYARRRPALAKVDFRIGDAQHLPFDDATFDLAVMALAIAFIPDPALAIAEMVRVTRPGGLVATYMWDLPGGGLPLKPIYGALKAMGMDSPMPPSADASRRERLQELWQAAGLLSVETEVFRIPVTFSDFEDFWRSNTVPVGPHGKFIEAMAPAAKEQLRARLRDTLPTAADGRIAYDAFANAVKGQRAG